jgi:hypothetical protein
VIGLRQLAIDGGPHPNDLPPSILENIQQEIVSCRNLSHLDEEQLLAITSIFENSMEPKNRIPLLIVGPPGTGKSSVIVEAAILASKYTQVIIFTPTNAAADSICEKFKVSNPVVVLLTPKSTSIYEKVIRFTSESATCDSERSLQTLVSDALQTEGNQTYEMMQDILLKEQVVAEFIKENPECEHLAAISVDNTFQEKIIQRDLTRYEVPYMYLRSIDCVRSFFPTLELLSLPSVMPVVKISPHYWIMLLNTTATIILLDS